VTQSGVIPAQRNRAPPCQIVADAAFLEPLKIGLKVLTYPLKDLLGSDSRPVFLLSIILGPLDSLIPLIFEFAQKSLPTWREALGTRASLTTLVYCVGSRVHHFRFRT
jgi:hypothetical protein